MHKRIAHCGHEYEREGQPRGRRRKLCDECRDARDADRLAGRDERLRLRAAVANEARWASRVLTACVQCGGELPPKRPTGPRSTYCSKQCLRAADRARNGARRNAERRERSRAERAKIVKVCVECGDRFSPRETVRQAFCSDRCKSRRFRDRATGACSETDCDRRVRAKGLCNMHYKRTLRAEGRIRTDPWNERRRAAWKARYAKSRGAPDAEKFDYREVYDRDGWVCGICSEPVDPSLTWPDPMSVSLDHVIPVSRGGRHSRENAQCSHLTCNVRKLDHVDVA